jgi:hypothetical protein
MRGLILVHNPFVADVMHPPPPNPHPQTPTPKPPPPPHTQHMSLDSPGTMTSRDVRTEMDVERFAETQNNDRR